MARRERPADGLWASYDQKVSPRQGWQGPYRGRPGRHLPRIGNSFGIPAGITCPGATGFCAGCYGKRSERQPGVSDALHHNLALLQAAAARAGTAGMTDLLDDLLARYEREAERLTQQERIFRVHWDGDFFSADYAEAWAAAMRAHPTVRFWCYTRSFRPPVDVLPTLAAVENLAVYLSIDAANRAHGAVQLARWPGIRAAYCAEDYMEGRQIAGERTARDLSRPMPCPENARTIPIAHKGQGACVLCGICPAARRDIVFATSHREISTDTVRRPARSRDSRRPERYRCKREGCGREFERPPGVRGRKPDYCSRDCQVKAYSRRKARAA